MDDDIDIYEDLLNPTSSESPSKKKQEENAIIIGLQNQVKELSEKLKTLEFEKKILNRNFSSLLKTAKLELSRKDKLISDLRSKSENAVFRRGNYAHKIKEPAVEKTLQQGKIKSIDVHEAPIVTDYLKNEENIIKTCNNFPKSFQRYNDNKDDEEDKLAVPAASTLYGERLRKRLKAEKDVEDKTLQESPEQHDRGAILESYKENRPELIMEKGIKLEKDSIINKIRDETSEQAFSNEMTPSVSEVIEGTEKRVNEEVTSLFSHKRLKLDNNDYNHYSHSKENPRNTITREGFESSLDAKQRLSIDNRLDKPHNEYSNLNENKWKSKLNRLSEDRNVKSNWRHYVEKDRKREVEDDYSRRRRKRSRSRYKDRLAYREADVHNNERSYSRGRDQKNERYDNYYNERDKDERVILPDRSYRSSSRSSRSSRDSDRREKKNQFKYNLSETNKLSAKNCNKNENNHETKNNVISLVQSNNDINNALIGKLAKKDESMNIDGGKGNTKPEKEGTPTKILEEGEINDTPESTPVKKINNHFDQQTLKEKLNCIKIEANNKDNSSILKAVEPIINAQILPDEKSIKIEGNDKGGGSLIEDVKPTENNKILPDEEKGIKIEGNDKSSPLIIEADKPTTINQILPEEESLKAEENNKDGLEITETLNPMITTHLLIDEESKRIEGKDKYYLSIVEDVKTTDNIQILHQEENIENIEKLIVNYNNQSSDCDLPDVFITKECEYVNVEGDNKINGQPIETIFDSTSLLNITGNLASIAEIPSCKTDEEISGYINDLKSEEELNNPLVKTSDLTIINEVLTNIVNLIEDSVSNKSKNVLEKCDVVKIDSTVEKETVMEESEVNHSDMKGKMIVMDHKNRNEKKFNEIKPIESVEKKKTTKAEKASVQKNEKKVTSTKSTPCKIFVLPRRRKEIKLSDSNASMKVVIKYDEIINNNVNHQNDSNSPLKPRSCKISRSYKTNG
ncbi:putative leucine-rich repeat-containing protein DDB_G0290503 [Prorops nasuta]|uniref:putative leucine-rich repeat-containing protein DDB_G0290503 n=1 Tax=Prorops nasuta TaxID=863751 RepID=UPI0034CF05CD